MIKSGEISVRMARFEDGVLKDLDGNEYFLHTADCDSVNRGEVCTCNGVDILEEILINLLSKDAEP